MLFIFDCSDLIILHENVNIKVQKLQTYTTNIYLDTENILDF